MTRYRWWLLLAFVFLVIFGTVTWWPVSPMWTVAIQIGRILGFVHEGKSVMVWDGTYESEGLALFDVETGRLLQKKTINFEKNWRNYGLQLLPDGKHFFCGQEYVDPTSNKTEDENGFSLVRPRRYEILDVDTHQVVAGPFIYSNSSHMTFSPDGRWFWSYNPSTGYGQDVIETMTGKTLFSARPNLDRRPFYACAFAPDSSAIAIQWYYDKTKRHEIEIVDLPDAKTRFTCLLPLDIRFDWGILDHWKNDRLFIQGYQVWRGSKAHKAPCFSFPIQADRLGEFREEPAWDGYFENGASETRSKAERYVLNRGDLLIQVSKGKLDDTPDWLNAMLASVNKTLGATISTRMNSATEVNVIDQRSGQLRYTLKSPDLNPWYIDVSPHGRRIASMHQPKGLMMWNADPFPRWPWAWGLGLLAVGFLQ
ncbi:MAG: hypothetical protein QM703_02430 [Gemmatales bacterium]